MSACDREEADDGDLKAGITLTKSGEDFAEAMASRQQGTGDPYVLNGVDVNGDTVEISVSYSGGCEKHDFEVIWDGTIGMGNPPVMNLILIHHANGDVCEAWITESLFFSLAALTDSLAIPDINLNAWSGYSEEDSVIYTVDPYEIKFPESDTCNLLVTARSAICGVGLYGNLWLALSDSVHAGADSFYFTRFLQPVAIEASLADFRPVEGKKYLVGARIEKPHDFDSIAVCLAWPGPSVPVRITCIRAAE